MITFNCGHCSTNHVQTDNRNVIGITTPDGDFYSAQHNPGEGCDGVTVNSATPEDRSSLESVGVKFTDCFDTEFADPVRADAVSVADFTRSAENDLAQLLMDPELGDPVRKSKVSSGDFASSVWTTLEQLDQAPEPK